MIFVADTSSGVNALAILEESGAVRQEVFLPARSPELIDRMRALVAPYRLTKVVVATGPGSFTGLRVGVSFGLGLAMGLRIPIVPLRTLELQAARSDSPVIAISEAGRGRLYYLEPGENPALGEPNEIPKAHRLVGFVTPAMESALGEAGHVFAPEGELRSFGSAAARLLESARDVPYGSLKLEYMQSISARPQ
ncbi:MAG TPA: tRNA (adenosine(37)-N6)-threonylcarbamoyltransferase complex dimerization subunit type 1 TsaB [Candidatus Dormibacteraeota bacterium]